MDDIYERLAVHMSELAIGPAYNMYLVEMLRYCLSEKEAEILLCLPTKVAPFEAISVSEVASKSPYTEHEIGSVLNKLAIRGLLYISEKDDHETRYSLHQFGYGMPQALFWPNKDTPFNRQMADFTVRHSTVEALAKSFGGTGDKVFRWVPVPESIEAGRERVLPYAHIGEIIDKTSLIAVVNCSCRVIARLKGREPCHHPLNVCMKYDQMAEYVLDTGIGRKISKDEAMALNREAEQAGCVHFADNTMPGEVLHACNCCPCCCWSLGNIKRRRIERDVLTACHFIRKTDFEACTGCGACVEACPIDVVEMKDDLPVVDNDWCIGCGVCALSCPVDAISMVRREDVPEPLPDLKTLSRKRLEQKNRR